MQDDHKSHQDLLRLMAQNLGLKLKETEEIPMLCNKRLPLLFHSTALWLISSPKGLHKMHLGGGSLSQENGNPGFPTLERQAYQGTVQPANGETNGFHLVRFKIPGSLGE